MHGLVKCRFSCARGVHVTIRDVTIKTLHRKWDRGREWRHAQKRWGFWVFEKKQLVEIWAWTREIRFSQLAEARPVVCGGGAARGEVQMEKSASKEIVCISPHVEKPLNSKRWIKISYLNKFRVFRIPSVHFTHPYLSRIFGPMYDTCTSDCYFEFLVSHPPCDLLASLSLWRYPFTAIIFKWTLT